MVAWRQQCAAWLSQLFACPRLRPAPWVMVLFGVLLQVSLILQLTVDAQEPSPDVPTQTDSTTDTLVTPEKVEVKPKNRDEAIAARLTEILEATAWFARPRARVRDGVVFLDGQTASQRYIDWATALASRTEGVVAVVNRMDLPELPWWNLSPAWAEVRQMGRNVIQASPFVVFALLVLLLTWMAARLTRRFAHSYMHRRGVVPLLQNVVAGIASTLMFIFGLYLVLRVSGLTRLAVTVVSGTGLVGLVLGIAFRDIAENFLASILISVRRPFRAGDMIDVAGHTGLVQQVTTRGTVMINLEGIYMQIPNATVYKSIIHNYSANPKRRADFGVGIGYQDSLSTAQDVALEVLRSHPAILPEPEPTVLIEGLGAATVDLRVSFWFDGTQHDMGKLKSSVIRLVKRAFQEAGILLSDTAPSERFPVQTPEAMPTPHESATIATRAEGALQSDKAGIQAQAEHTAFPDKGENLLMQHHQEAVPRREATAR
ncbi:MAG: mechanosensitive ion channel domain-containing protein [Candidatus Tectimicrobiota bacterium]